jgi:prepilin-type processing-associated H-X9-DG protein
MYVQDCDDTLPHWYVGGLPHTVLWPEMLRSYYRSPGILKDAGQREGRAGELRTADYALCAWGAGGKGTQEEPDWLWPGAIDSDPESRGPMRLAEVRRPANTLQFADGATVYYGYDHIFPNSRIETRHMSGMFNGAFLDGHAGVISDQLLYKISRDEHGYFYWIAAAKR